MQLDRVPPRLIALQLLGTATPADGVPQRVERRRPPEARPKAPPGAWALVFVVCASVLGQGERAAVDHRFATAVRTLQTYWAALAADDVDTASECLDEGPYSGPYPGMVWFLPPTRELKLTSFVTLPIQRGRMMVNYEVRYTPLGTNDEQVFETQAQLVQIRGAWRISQPIDAASMPPWRPTERPQVI